jgi:hypothetical protein
LTSAAIIRQLLEIFLLKKIKIRKEYRKGRKGIMNEDAKETIPR